MIRLCVADQHPILLAGMQAWLQNQDGIEVVGAATTGSAAWAFLEGLKPDIALLDARLPGIDGLELAAWLRQAALPTRVILFSACDAPADLRKALEVGISGYVLKRSAADHLLLAIRAVHEGGTYVDPALAAAFWHGMGGASPPTQLPTRETEVLRAVAFGFSIKEVAGLLGVTSKSVETYKTRACEKLRLGSRAQIVRHALAQGWFAEGATAPEASSRLRAGSAVSWPSPH